MQSMAQMTGFRGLRVKDYWSVTIPTGDFRKYILTVATLHPFCNIDLLLHIGSESLYFMILWILPEGQLRRGRLWTAL